MNKNQINLSKNRREYIYGKLRRKNLSKEPMQLFKLWLNQAYSKNIPDPTAMCLATVNNIGQPYQRLVLLKSFTNRNMIFFTNLKSKKSIHITNNSKISLCFPWHALDRQVIIIGNAQKLPKNKVIKYFYSRPRNNQISSWVSPQSNKIVSRNFLEKKFSKLKIKFLNKKIPFPNFWGGYKIDFHSIEFWQGRIYRLHDRFIYQRYKKNAWRISRLAP